MVWVFITTCVRVGGVLGAGGNNIVVENSLSVLAAASIVVGQNGVSLDVTLNVDGLERRGRIDRPKGSKSLWFMKGNGIDISAIKLSIRMGTPRPTA